MKSPLTFHSEVEVYVDWRMFRTSRFSRQNRISYSGRTWVPFSNWRLAYLDFSFHLFPQFFKGVVGIVPRLGHGGVFLASPFSLPVLRSCISPTLRR
jgi:hypothetical protein